MKQINQTRRLYALALAMMAVGTLSACTQAERSTTVETPGTQREVRGYEEQQQAGAPITQQQGAGAQSGREFFINLKPGQPVNYYTQEFTRMGYQVMDVNRSEDRVTYDLRKDDERFQVSLMTDETNNQIVRDTDVQEYKKMSASQQQGNQNVNKIVQQVEKLQPGKKPVEYLSQLSQWGQVRQFNANDDNARVEMETPNNQKFEVQMQVDPQRQVVTDIEVNKDNFWSI